MIPTVGFNMRKVTKGNVTIKVGNKHSYPSLCYYCEYSYSGSVSAYSVTLISVILLFLASDMGHRWTAPLQKHVGALL